MYHSIGAIVTGQSMPPGSAWVTPGVKPATQLDLYEQHCGPAPAKQPSAGGSKQEWDVWRNCVNSKFDLSGKLKPVAAQRPQATTPPPPGVPSRPEKINVDIDYGWPPWWLLGLGALSVGVYYLTQKKRR
jgi:hypothetical protein